MVCGSDKHEAQGNTPHLLRIYGISAKWVSLCRDKHNIKRLSVLVYLL